MTVYLLLGLGSAALTWVITPLVSNAARRLGLVDAPGGRKVHVRPVPRLGGVAVVGATLVAMILVRLWGPRDFGPAIWPGLWALGAAVSLVFAVGLTDDIRGASPSTKLVVEFAAAVVVMTSGLLIERVTLFGTSLDLGWLAWPLTAAWIVGLTNAFNLIDGLDGLAAGTAALAGATCTAILLARGHVGEALLITALAGAAAGFLAFNFPPASIFLGDSGSLVIGFLLATTAVSGWQKGATALATGVPLLMFALPIADVITTIARRGLDRPAAGWPSPTVMLQRLVQPDRLHIHHRLLGYGWSPRRALLICYGVTTVLSLLALATAQTP